MPKEQNLKSSFYKYISKGFEIINDIPNFDYHHHERKLIFSRDQVSMYHYVSPKKSKRIPILIVFATVNRPEILEINKQYSFIGALLKEGLDVYLIDWGSFQADAQAISFSDYVNVYLHDCIKFLKNKLKQKKINILGICQGGVISLCYASIYQNIKNLILISTPIDFHTSDNTITNFIKTLDVDFIQSKTNQIPGSILTQFFISLRPFDLLGKKYLKLMDCLQDKKFVKKFLSVEKWLYDSPNQSSLAFCEFIDYFYQSNQLIKNKLKLGDKKVDLSKLNTPILNIMAENDHIVPNSASKVLKNFMSKTNYSEKTFKSGHIGIYINDQILPAMAKCIVGWAGRV